MSADEIRKVDYWTRADDGRVLCLLCPRACRMRAGQRGLCFVRKAADDGDGMELTGYGRSTGFCVDPIEKKPLNHFLPGSAVLSFGTAGCNLACSFCQNHDSSKSRETALMSARAAPDTIARAAKALGCASVAYTYNDPVIFLEYAFDTAQECRALGVNNVAVTAGFINPEPRAKFFSVIDAANVDLKGFTERFYEKNCAASLEPVKDTLRYLIHETKVWTEITTLLIPGETDSDEEIADGLDCEGLADRRPPALLRLPPRLSHARQALDAGCDPGPRPLDRAGSRAETCLRRQRPRSRAAGDALPELRNPPDWPRRL